MSTTTAVVVGALLGFLFMVAVSIWVAVTGGLSRRAAYTAIGAFLGIQLVLAVSAGSFKSALLLMAGCLCGLAVSSIVTLPLTALLYKRFSDRHVPLG